jgi:thiol-disulfide isomerase/thioredoxin
MPNQSLAVLLLTASTLLAGPAHASGPLTWSHDPQAAFATAKSSGKLLLVDAYADWCGWCKKLERDVFPDPRFVEVARDFVLLRIDVEDGAEGSRMADEYGADSLPTLLLLEPSGALAGVVTGFEPASEMAQSIRSALADHQRTLDEFRRTLASGDVQKLQLSALDFYGHHDGGRAAELFEKVLASSRQAPVDEAWTRYLLADAWRMADDLAKARAEAKLAAAAAARAGDGGQELADRVALLPFWIAETGGDCSEAASALASFERSHPASPFLSEARRALERLRAEPDSRCS